MKKGKIPEKNYIEWLSEIKKQIRNAQYEAMKAVNTEIISLYWEIGRSITEKQADGWGKSVVEQLSIEIFGICHSSIMNTMKINFCNHWLQK